MKAVRCQYNGLHMDVQHRGECIAHRSENCLMCPGVVVKLVRCSKGLLTWNTGTPVTVSQLPLCVAEMEGDRYV